MAAENDAQFCVRSDGFRAAQICSDKCSDKPLFGFRKSSICNTYVASGRAPYPPLTERETGRDDESRFDPFFSAAVIGGNDDLFDGSWGWEAALGSPKAESVRDDRDAG